MYNRKGMLSLGIFLIIVGIILISIHTTLKAYGPTGLWTDIAVEPEYPTTKDVISITIYGFDDSECSWPPPNTCYLTDVSDNTLEVTAVISGIFPPVCLPAGNWSCTVEVGRLPPGPYIAVGYVYWRLVGVRTFGVSAIPITVTISSSGGSLVSNEVDVNTSIDFPAGSTTNGTVITYTRQWPLPLPSSFRSTGYFFSLETDTQGNSSLVFSKPVTISIQYPNPAQNLNPFNHFDLYWLENTAWITEGTTLVERTDNAITTTINQPALFSVLVAVYPLYLPIISK